MSYSIQLEVKDNVVTVTGQTVEVPDGKFSINGHDTAADGQISVARFRLSDGGVVAQASGFVNKTSQEG